MMTALMSGSRDALLLCKAHPASSVSLPLPLSFLTSSPTLLFHLSSSSSSYMSAFPVSIHLSLSTSQTIPGSSSGLSSSWSFKSFYTASFLLCVCMVGLRKDARGEGENPETRGQSSQPSAGSGQHCPEEPVEQKVQEK